MYLKYPIEILKPNIDFLVNNSTSQYDNHDKILEEEKGTVEEDIGIVRTT